MNNKTSENDTLAFLEALAGEYTGGEASRGSWHQRFRDTLPDFVSDLRTPVVALF